MKWDLTKTDSFLNDESLNLIDNLKEAMSGALESRWSVLGPRESQSRVATQRIRNREGQESDSPNGSQGIRSKLVRMLQYVRDQDKGSHPNGSRKEWSKE